MQFTDRKTLPYEPKAKFTDRYSAGILDNSPLPGWQDCAHLLGTGQTVCWCSSVSFALIVFCPTAQILEEGYELNKLLADKMHAQHVSQITNVSYFGEKPLISPDILW